MQLDLLPATPSPDFFECWPACFSEAELSELEIKLPWIVSQRSRLQRKRFPEMAGDSWPYFFPQSIKSEYANTEEFDLPFGDHALPPPALCLILRKIYPEVLAITRSYSVTERYNKMGYEGIHHECTLKLQFQNREPVELAYGWHPDEPGLLVFEAKFEMLKQIPWHLPVWESEHVLAQYRPLDAEFYRETKRRMSAFVSPDATKAMKNLETHLDPMLPPTRD